MAYRRKVTRRTFKRTTVSKRRVARRRAVRRPMRRASLRRAVRSVAEKKCNNTVDLGQLVVPAVYANANTADTQVFQVSPGSGNWAIQQGPSQDERIGNRIHIQKATLKGTIVPNPYNATTMPVPSPCVVHMVLFYDRLNPTIFPAPVAGNNFFQFGSTSSGFRNDIVDTWAPINTDRWRVLCRRTWKVGYAAYEGTGIQVGAQAFHNNDFKLNQNFSIDLTPYLVKDVRYMDNDSDPSTRGLWCFFQAIAADGTAYNYAREPATVQYSLDLSYTDV